MFTDLISLFQYQFYPVYCLAILCKVAKQQSQTHKLGDGKGGSRHTEKVT